MTSLLSEISHLRSAELISGVPLIVITFPVAVDLYDFI